MHDAIRFTVVNMTKFWLVLGNNKNEVATGSAGSIYQYPLQNLMLSKHVNLQEIIMRTSIVQINKNINFIKWSGWVQKWIV